MPRRRMLRTLAVSAGVALCALSPAAALAAPTATLTVLKPVEASEAVLIGGKARVRATITSDIEGVDVASQDVELQANAWPFTGGFVPVQTSTTNAKGVVTFAPTVTRNVRYRVVWKYEVPVVPGAPAPTATSATSKAVAVWADLDAEVKGRWNADADLVVTLTAPRSGLPLGSLSWWVYARVNKQGPFVRYAKTPSVIKRANVTARAVLNIPNPYRVTWIEYAMCAKPSPVKHGLSNPTAVAASKCGNRTVAVGEFGSK